MDTLRFVHFADAHIDVDTIGPIDPDTGVNGRVMDRLDMLDSIIDFAADEHVHLALFAGDAYQRATTSPVYQNLFAERMSRLRTICPVAMVLGNHDMLKATRTSNLQLYNTLGVDKIVVGDRAQMQLIDTEVGKVQIAFMPYPTRQSLQHDQVKGKTLQEVTDFIQERTGKIINKLSESMDDSMPSILLGHFTVAASQYGSERGFAEMIDAEVDPAVLLDPVWDYVALGHIHMYQDIRDRLAEDGEAPDILEITPPVVYSGSIERVSFNEEKETKGFVYGEIEDCQDRFRANYEFIELDARPYKTIEVSIKTSNPTREVLAKIARMNLKDAVTRVIIHAEEDERQAIHKDEILNTLDRAGIYCLSSYQIVVKREVQTRLSNDQFNAGMYADDLVEAYLQHIGKTPKEIKPLLDKAIEIMTEVDNGQ